MRAKYYNIAIMNIKRIVFGLGKCNCSNEYHYAFHYRKSSLSTHY